MLKLKTHFSQYSIFSHTTGCQNSDDLYPCIQLRCQHHILGETWCNILPQIISFDYFALHSISGLQAYKLYLRSWHSDWKTMLTQYGKLLNQNKENSVSVLSKRFVDGNKITGYHGLFRSPNGYDESSHIKARKVVSSTVLSKLRPESRQLNANHRILFTK